MEVYMQLLEVMRWVRLTFWYRKLELLQRHLLALIYTYVMTGGTQSNQNLRERCSVRLKLQVLHINLYSMGVSSSIAHLRLVSDSRYFCIVELLSWMTDNIHSIDLILCSGATALLHAWSHQSAEELIFCCNREISRANIGTDKSIT